MEPSENTMEIYFILKRKLKEDLKFADTKECKAMIDRIKQSVVRVIGNGTTEN